MQFLKTLLWVIVAVAFVIFGTENWNPVRIHLFGGVVLDTKLPAIILIVFIIGFLPLYVYHKAVTWRLRKRVLSLENERRRAIAEHAQHTDVAGGAASGDAAPIPASAEPAQPASITDKT